MFQGLSPARVNRKSMPFQVLLVSAMSALASVNSVHRTVVALPTADGASKTRRKMVWIPDNSFLMGSDSPAPAYLGLEDPARRCTTSPSGFCPRLLDGSNHRNEHTVCALREGNWIYRDSRKPAMTSTSDAVLVPGSLVFVSPDFALPPKDYGQLWRYIPGTDWRHPDGPGSSSEIKATTR